MDRWKRVVSRGITAGVLWTWCGWGKNLQFGAVGVLCRRSGGSKTALPLETGTAWGRLLGRGKGRETGTCRGCLAPAAGPAVWWPGCRFAGAVGPARPLHLIHGGASSSVEYSAGAVSSPHTATRRQIRWFGPARNHAAPDGVQRPDLANR